MVITVKNLYVTVGFYISFYGCEHFIIASSLVNTIIVVTMALKLKLMLLFFTNNLINIPQHKIMH